MQSPGEHQHQDGDLLEEDHTAASDMRRDVQELNSNVQAMHDAVRDHQSRFRASE